MHQNIHLQITNLHDLAIITDADVSEKYLMAMQMCPSQQTENGRNSDGETTIQITSDIPSDVSELDYDGNWQLTLLAPIYYDKNNKVYPNLMAKFSHDRVI